MPKEVPRLLALFFCALAFTLIASHWNLLPGEYDQFHIAVRQFVSHQNAYDASVYPKSYEYGFINLPMTIILQIPFNLFSLNVSIAIWNLALLFLLGRIVYLWISLEVNRSIQWAEYAAFFLISLIPSVLWTLMVHQTSLMVLWFASEAIWENEHQGRGWRVGALCALSFCKPQLTLPFVILMWSHAREKKMFCVSFLATFAAFFIPYTGIWRPWTDLRSMMDASWNYSRHVYFIDEQSISSLAHAFYLSVTHASSFGNAANASILQKKVLKLVTTLVVFPVLCHKLTKSHKPLPYIASFSLAAGLLFGSYSHYYDGVLVLPIFLIACARLESAIGLHRAVVLAVLFNIISEFLLLHQWNSIPLNGAGISVLLYTTASALIFYYLKNIYLGQEKPIA